MQIAGSTCHICGLNVVFAEDGKYCARCGTVEHLECNVGSNCGVCGEVFSLNEKLGASPDCKESNLDELGQIRSSHRALVLLLPLTLALLLFAFIYAFLDWLTGGH